MNISYPVAALSNSNEISAFSFNQTLKQISFNLIGISGMQGLCNVTIPKTSWKENLGQLNLMGLTGLLHRPTTKLVASFISITHASTYEVTTQGTWVVPEFSSTPILALFMTITLTTIVLLKKKRKYKPLNFPLSS